MNRVKFFLLNILLLLSTFVYSWERQSENYEPTVYGGGTQNWQIKQANNGWIYFANNNGLLEFDGYTWNTYSMHNRIVRAIMFDADYIYAGGNNLFGYYRRTDKGQLQFTSLSSQIHKSWKGNIWEIYKIKDKVFFIDDHNVYVFKNFKYQYTVTSKTKIDSRLLSSDAIYIGTSDGIAYLKYDSKSFRNTQYTNLGTKTNSDRFKIIELLSYGKQFIVVTAHSGVYVTSNGDLKKIQTAGDHFIASNQLFCAALQGSVFAIGSVQNGLLLLDLDRPDYYEVINQDNILKNNTVLSCFFDKNKNLWIGLDNGISFINMNESFNPLFTKESPIGTGYCSAYYNNTLYLGTNQGLYTLNGFGKPVFVNGAEGQIISLNKLHGALFSCGDNGILVFDGVNKYPIDVPGVIGVYSVPKRDDLLIAGSYFGLKLLVNKNGRWVYSHDISGMEMGCKGGITFYKGREYWQTNPDDNFVNKLTFDPDFKTVKTEKYSLGDNVVLNNSSISVVDNNPIVCTDGGLFRYAVSENKFVPYVELENVLEGNQVYEFLLVDEMKNIWYKTDESLRFLPYRNNRVDYNKYYVGFEAQMINGSENVTMLDSVSAIIGTYKGFSQIRIDKIQSQQNLSEVYIRDIKTFKDGEYTVYGRAAKDAILPYGSNTVSFTWGGFSASNEGEVLYSYRLVGLDDEWSIPTKKHIKEYTNLGEGTYTFEVKTSIKNRTSGSSATDSITFRILPPWYRSGIAYTCYVILIFTAFLAGYKVIVRNKEKVIEEKKKTIEYQKLLLKEEARVKDAKIHELEKDKLESDLQYKTHEITGYILSISQKNEMFDRIKKESSVVLKLIDSKGSILAIRKKISDLIQQINNNVKHDDDFDVFKSNFDFVHKDFFKVLETKYPQLTQKDKVLCAYIKMNLVSKEIAPLLNISVRGVEINRYNLRKKMNLDRNVNLSEFLNTLTLDLTD